MFELSLIRGDKIFTKKTIHNESFTIGRSNDNSLRLSDEDISRHHCKIEHANKNIFLTDFSTNGTFVNGEITKERELNAGDKLTIGSWTILIDKAETSNLPRTVVSNARATKVISFDEKEKELTTKHFEFNITSPSNQPFKKSISASEIVFGNNGSCDIAIADMFCSRRHCKISSHDDKLKLTDLESTNGTFVNGTRIRETLLPPSGEFMVGRSTVSYKVSRVTEKIRASKETQLGMMIGRSQEMREIFTLIEKLAPADVPVCITGESGTGKELVARELHLRSQKAGGPFIAINCGAVPATIIESQLFGHERGAFTGADERMTGLFEQAKGGTLFLDEIGEMPLDLQTRLLRVLETMTVRRIGGNEDIPVDFRLVSATNRDIKKCVSEGKFREDLFFRIFVVPVKIVPLRERLEDIRALASHFLSMGTGKDFLITDSAIDKLLSHNWPGNVRELKNTINRSVVLASSNTIDAPDIKIEMMQSAVTENSALKENERAIIIGVLNECNGNLSKTALKLNIARTTLQKKIKKYEIEMSNNKISS